VPNVEQGEMLMLDESVSLFTRNNDPFAMSRVFTNEKSLGKSVGINEKPPISGNFRWILLSDPRCVRIWRRSSSESQGVAGRLASNAGFALGLFR
jgi:hypothetical protein